MPSTQQLSITLPNEMADVSARKLLLASVQPKAKLSGTDCGPCLRGIAPWKAGYVSR